MQTKIFTKRGLSIFGIISILMLISIGIYVRTLFDPPATFTQEKQLEITSGMSVKDIAITAQQQGIVRSNLLLYAILTYSYDPTDIYAGMYIFEKPTSVFGVAQKLANKDIENNLLRVTLPEGIRATDIAQIAKNILSDFNSTQYLEASKEFEGYLFPETYFVPETFDAQDLINLQRETYEENVSPLRTKIQESSFSEYEVLILASIIEREANDEESMRTISGIFQNRLDIGMPLQADASIEYIIDTPLNQLAPGQLASELRKTDSPYNTYLNKDLPPTPIGNPGITAIKAVLEPVESDYFYYITDNTGVFHYAKTLQQHNQNINKFLK